MKRIFIILLLLCSLAGCSSGKETIKKDSNKDKEVVVKKENKMKYVVEPQNDVKTSDLI